MSLGACQGSQQVPAILGLLMVKPVPASEGSLRKHFLLSVQFFSAPRGKQQELHCWPCMSECSWLEERHSLSTACLRPLGFIGYNQTLHRALRDPRGAPSKQCPHLPTSAGYPWDESIACSFVLCQRHGRITAGAVLVGGKGCKFMAEIKLLNS